MVFSRSKFKSAFFEPPLAHRALHDARLGVLENSLEAIEAAMAAGFGIEIDLQQTRDARAVVFHDEKLNRLTTQKGLVRDLDLAQLQALGLENGNHILSFRQCLELVNGNAPLLVEIKDQDGTLGKNIGQFLPDIIQSVRDYDGAIALMSFNPYIIAHLRAAMPEAALGLVGEPFGRWDWPKLPRERAKRLRDYREIPGLDIDFVSHKWQDLERIEALDLPKLCWTVKSPSDEIAARKFADNITFENYIPQFDDP